MSGLTISERWDWHRALRRRKVNFLAISLSNTYNKGEAYWAIRDKGE